VRCCVRPLKIVPRKNICFVLLARSCFHYSVVYFFCTILTPCKILAAVSITLYIYCFFRRNKFLPVLRLEKTGFLETLIIIRYTALTCNVYLNKKNNSNKAKLNPYSSTSSRQNIKLCKKKKKNCMPGWCLSQFGVCLLKFGGSKVKQS
jgi:hypothetical protein